MSVSVSSGDIRYLYLLHQPVLLFVVRLGELVDLDFVLCYFPHDLERKKTFSNFLARLIMSKLSRQGTFHMVPCLSLWRRTC